MGTIARIHWIRALMGGFLAEACLIGVVIPVSKIFGQHALLYVVPPAALVTKDHQVMSNHTAHW